MWITVNYGMNFEYFTQQFKTLYQKVIFVPLFSHSVMGLRGILIIFNQKVGVSFCVVPKLKNWGILYFRLSDLPVIGAHEDRTVLGNSSLNKHILLTQIITS